MQVNSKIKLPIVPASSMDFLKKIGDNNNREWFNAHKDEFLKEQQHIVDFADGLLSALNVHDVIETPSGKKSLHRIYRDTRFSKFKTPYKTNWSGNFSRATKFRRGGYFFHLEPGNSYIGGGFQAPNAGDLKLIRDDISFDDAPFRKIISSPSFVANFGEIRGTQLITAPKGYAADHEAIDLLRYKQFRMIRKFSDEEVLNSSFVVLADQGYQAMRPFFDYMSEVLTTDLNGE